MYLVPLYLPPLGWNLRDRQGGQSFWVLLSSQLILGNKKTQGDFYWVEIATLKRSCQLNFSVLWHESTWSGSLKPSGGAVTQHLLNRVIFNSLLSPAWSYFPSVCELHLAPVQPSVDHDHWTLHRAGGDLSTALLLGVRRLLCCKLRSYCGFRFECALTALSPATTKVSTSKPADSPVASSVLPEWHTLCIILHLFGEAEQEIYILALLKPHTRIGAQLGWRKAWGGDRARKHISIVWGPSCYMLHSQCFTFSCHTAFCRVIFRGGTVWHIKNVEGMKIFPCYQQITCRKEIHFSLLFCGPCAFIVHSPANWDTFVIETAMLYCLNNTTAE